MIEQRGEYMNEIRYVISIILGGFGLYIITMNWCIVWVSLIKKKEHHSFGPLLGPICLSIALIVIPNNPYASLWWLTFIADFGSLPFIILSIIFFLMGKHKK